MKITILGSGTCVPSLVRKPCSVLVRYGKRHIVLDIGPGIIGQLLHAGVSPDDVDMICLSHFHLDHCADLAPFIFSTKYPVYHRKKKLHLLGGTGLNNLYENLNQAFHGNLEMPDTDLELTELEETGQADSDKEGLKLSWIKPVHKPESRSFRFETPGGRRFVYTGDTDYCESLIDFAKEADLMICESAMPDDLKVPGHLTPGLVGDIAKKAGVKKLVLTHLYPECDQADIKSQCRKRFNGEIVLAKDLMHLTI